MAGRHFPARRADRGGEMSDLKPWRDRVKPHPAADLFPMMSEPDLTELAEDIAGSGLRQGVVLWTPDRKSYGDGPPEENYLLDGRNRLQAVERAFSDPGERDAS